MWKTRRMLLVVIDVNRLASTLQLEQRTRLTLYSQRPLEALDMVVETLKKRESDGEGTGWGRDLSVVYL